MLWLGVDGGGTRTRSLLAAADGTIVGRGEGGACNATRCSPRQLAESLTAALSGVPWARVRGACFGLAGVYRTEARARAEAVVRDLCPVPFLLRNDAEVALAGAFEGEAGILVQAGTGAIALGQDGLGGSFRCGGWGWILGDEGSAVWIGREAAAAVLQAHDGRGRRTALTEAVVADLGLAAVEDLVGLVHGDRPPPETLGGLLAPVHRAAHDGDMVAAAILDRAGRHLADLARTLSRRHSIRRIAYGGGVFERAPQAKRAFLAALADLDVAAVARGGAEGALWLATRAFTR